MEAEMQKRQNDYLTTSNDNTWVEPRTLEAKAAKPKNPHLAQRAVEGAKAWAANDKRFIEEHPILATVGDVASVAPFAVAAAPAVTVAGDALAGSAVGQGITPLLTNPWFDAAMTSLGGAHAAQSIANGEADWMTALELAPMTRVVKPMYNAARETGNALYKYAYAPSSTDEGLVVSAIPDFRTDIKTNLSFFRNFDPHRDYSKVRKIVQEAAPKKNININENFKIDSDKRFMMFEPGRFINYDVGNMSVEEIVNTFGPEAKYYKGLYDIAKAHNFEGKYAQIGKDAEFNILNRFAISKTDPDVAKGLEEARSIYSIPEYRARFNKWGTLGDTFVDDALARLDNVQLQGRSKTLPIKGQHGVHGGAYTSPDATTIGIANSESSSWIQDMIRHEANHTSHGLKRQPDWMRYHNQKLRPVVREGKPVNTPESKYLDEMDEIVERSKTAVEYAHKIRKEGETLDQALSRLADMADANIYDASIPADVRQMVSRFTKESTLNFWKNFVGGYALPTTIGGATIYGTSQNEKGLGGYFRQ